jgi:putative ABC transport system permease protein
MSLRERAREVAVLRTLGFTSQRILTLFLGESVSLAVVGGVLGVLTTAVLMQVIGKSNLGIRIPAATKVKFATMVVAIAVAGLVGALSALIPSYRASHGNIVEGLRHIG